MLSGPQYFVIADGDDRSDESIVQQYVALDGRSRGRPSNLERDCRSGRERARGRRKPRQRQAEAEEREDEERSQVIQQFGRQEEEEEEEGAEEKETKAEKEQEEQGRVPGEQHRQCATGGKSEPPSCEVARSPNVTLCKAWPFSSDEWHGRRCDAVVTAEARRAGTKAERTPSMRSKAGVGQSFYGPSAFLDSASFRSFDELAAEGSATLEGGTIRSGGGEGSDFHECGPYPAEDRRSMEGAAQKASVAEVMYCPMMVSMPYTDFDGNDSDFEVWTPAHRRFHLPTIEPFPEAQVVEKKMLAPQATVQEDLEKENPQSQSVEKSILEFVDSMMRMVKRGEIEPMLVADFITKARML